MLKETEKNALKAKRDEGKNHFKQNRNILLFKVKESIQAVLPITLIVLVLCFSIVDIPSGALLSFVIGAILLVIGMGLFTLGADMALTPLGERVGAIITKKRSILLIVVIGFVLGAMITISEPDLQVLANQVPSLDSSLIIYTVAVGVGVFLVIALLRIVFSIKLRYLLLFFYAVIFILAYFVPNDFLGVAFDSGGVTTGPMTVPFIMALGVGVSSIRTDSESENDSFGLVALCSVGPILAVLILGLIFNVQGGEYIPASLPSSATSIELWGDYLHAFPEYFLEMAISIAPIFIFFLIFQVVAMKLSRSSFIRMSVGMLYTYIGLVLFLTGVNVGFMPVGNYLGGALASLNWNWILIPIAMLIGYFIVTAEPAVHVLNKQVEDVTAGAIQSKSMKTALSVGVAFSLGLAMVRVLTGINIMWFLIPGYALALGLSFVVPSIFTSIAFDSGGVASGPMTATFLLPLATGASSALGGNVVADAFGVVAMVAMTPLITVQIMGLFYKLKMSKLEAAEIAEQSEKTTEEEIIDL